MYIFLEIFIFIYIHIYIWDYLINCTYIIPTFIKLLGTTGLSYTYYRSVNPWILSFILSKMQNIRYLIAWTSKWKIKINIQKVRILYENSAKYLSRQEKRMEFGLSYRQMCWLLGRQNKLSIPNKILIYNQILKPVWIYCC